jgi:hypothetical protein
MQNFDGLGIGFDVQDNGAEGKVSGISRSFDNLWNSVKDAGSSIPRVTSKIAQGLNRMGERSSRYVGLVTTAVGGMIDSAMDPKLDSAYASMYATFNKEFSSLTAGMKDTDGELNAARKRIGGIAQGMGEDMNQAAQSWVSFRKQGIALDKVLGTEGLSNTIKRMIKLTSVFGLEGKQLANVAGTLKRGFGFTEEQIGALGDKIVAIGQEFDMGRESIQAWPQIMSSLNNQLATFGEQLTPQRLDSLTTSIVQLGGGFHEALGIDATEATELAINAFTVLAGEGKNIARMAIGMGGPFSDMGKEIMAAGDDLSQVFNVMASKDPLRFMDMLREVGKTAQQRGGETGVAFQRLNAVINDTIGPNVAFATAGNWDLVTEKMRKMPDVIAGSKGTLNEVAQAHWKSSITSGEAWEMMMNNMRAKVFRLSHGEVKKWQKNMREGFQRSFGVVKAFASDDGPIGELTRKLLAVQRVGLSALLPGLGSLAPILGGITEQALPMMTALGSMGVRFSDLGKLAGVGGGAYLLFQTLTKGPDAVVEKFTNMRHSVVNILEKKIFTGKKNSGIRGAIHEINADWDKIGLVGTIEKQLKRIPWDTVWNALWGQAEKIARSIGDVLSRIPWEKVGKTVFGFLGKGIRGVSDGIWSFVFGDSGDKVSDPVSRLIKDAVMGGIGIVWEAAKGALKGLWESIFEADSLEDTFKNITKIAATGFGALLVLSKGFRKKIAGGLWDVLTKPTNKPVTGGAVDYYGGGIPGMIPGLAPKPTPYARPAHMVDQQTFQFGKETIPMGAQAAPDYNKQLIEQQGRLSGGVLLPNQVASNPDMVLGPGGWVPKGGLEGGKIRQTTRRERFRQWRLEKRERFAQTKPGRALGRAKGAWNKLGGMGGVGAMAGLVASVEQTSSRAEMVQKLANSRMLNEQEKFLISNEETLKGVTNTVNALFLGLPGMVGNILGITEQDILGFYHKAVAGGEIAITATVEGFQFLGRSAVNVWGMISSGAEMLFARLDHGFGLIKNSALGILYDVGEFLQTNVKGWGFKLMYPFEWFSFQMKTWMADFIENIFGKPGESNAITKVLSSVVGEDTVKNIQKYGKSVRREQQSILGGEKTFDEAFDKRVKKSQSADQQYWDGRRQALKKERQDINQTFLVTQESLAKKAKQTGIDAIIQDAEDTKNFIAQQSSRLMQEAEGNAVKAELARRTLEQESQLKSEAQLSAVESAKRAREEADKKKGNRNGGKRNRPQTKYPEETIAASPQKMPSPSIPSKEDRAAAASIPVDVAKILEENKNHIAEMKRTMASMQTSIQNVADRPINMTVVSKLDGKKVGEGVDRHMRKNARF